jgi:hypothetical protein
VLASGKIRLELTAMRARVLFSFLLFVAVTVLSAPWVESQSDSEVPHFHAAPPVPGEKLPAILTKDQLSGLNLEYAYQAHAYELAAKIPRVLYQQPCYCYCDRSMDHTSLHSCFSGTHGAHCSTCMQELYYTYTMYKRRKTAQQIRAGIIKGDWKAIDLTKAASIN